MEPRLRAGGEVRVIPALRRDEKTSFVPVDLDELAILGSGLRFVFWPHERISLAAKNDHLRAGAMIVRLAISPAADRHDMPYHGLVPRAGNPEPAIVDAATRIFRQRHGIDIRNEIDRRILEFSFL